MANGVDQDQTAPIGAVCSGSTLLAYILNLSVMLGNYLQQTTSADDIFRCIFSWRFKGYSYTPEVSSIMRELAGRSLTGTYLYSLCVKPDTSTTSASKRSHC